MAKKATTKSTPRPAVTSLLAEAKMVNQLHWSYPGMQVYAEQEKVIHQLFRKVWAFQNTQLDVVRSKVGILNVCYSTHIAAITKMAQGICALPNVDARLQSGDITLVTDIANIIPGRHNISFASKYCACHNPKAFPIYDNFVSTTLAKIIAKGNLKGSCGTWTNVHKQMQHDYASYKEVYDAFMTQYKLKSLTYRQVDWYIWTAVKCNMNQLNLFQLV